MAVSAISGCSQVQNIYAFRNTHYNQVQTVPVTPVSRAHGIVPVTEEEDETRLAAAIGRSDQEKAERIEASALAKQTEKIKDTYAEKQELQYDLSNPYEAARMSIDGMLVAGMNINVMA